MRIRQLPPALANQIAAGEVIERPASVVKELLENALDAEANNIIIEIGYGGLNQIKVSDNGIGIIAEDLPLAVAAHATSKISTLDDLYAIDTMGFRGEALASIASVARVSISSRPDHQEHAMMLRIKGAQNELFPCARSVGTTIDVVDLFFNAPVRKRFLKNEKLEFQAIEIVVKRFALSAPHITVTLKHNNKLVLSLPAAISEQLKYTRMAKIFGSAFIKDAVYVDVEGGGMHLSGWVSGPNYQRSQNDRQWVYINQRMIKDKLINHALKQAYDELLYPGRFPACLLYLTLPTAEVDVNVHPTKHEVRFQQPRLVHDFFTTQLAKVLTSGVLKDQARIYEQEVCSSGEASDINEPLFYSPEHSGVESVYTASSATVVPVAVAVGKSVPLLPDSLGYDTYLQKHGASKTKTPDSYSGSESSWVFLNKLYALIFVQQQPYLVDVVALQQQWILNQLKQTKLPFASRPLLVPVSYPISPKLINRKQELKTQCEQLGVIIELSQEDQLLIRGVPINVPYLDIRLFLAALAKLDLFEFKQLIEILSQSQCFDPKQLTVEERLELDKWLVSMQNKPNGSGGLFKAMSLENCRMLLNV